MKTLLRHLTAAVLALSAFGQTQWQLRYPLPTPHGLLGGTYAQGLYVAVGYYGTIITSPDGVIWTARSTEGPVNWMDVAHGNGQFVAVGYRADQQRPWIIAAASQTSVDGVTWTPQAERPGRKHLRVIFAHNVFITLVDVFDESGDWRPVIETSADGRRWTERWRGEGGSGVWYERSLVAQGATILAGHSSDTPSVFLRSTNGLAWEAVEAPAPFHALSMVSSRFVGFASNQTNTLSFVSEDGLHWESFPLVPGVSANSPAFGDGRFIALGGREDPECCGIVSLQSEDGRSWTEVPGSGFRLGYSRELVHSISRIIRGPVGWLLIGQDQAGQAGPNNFSRIYTSPDGAVWTNRMTGAEFPGRVFVVFEDDAWVARNEDGTWFARSTTGLDWRRPDSQPVLPKPSERPDQGMATDGRITVQGFPAVIFANGQFHALEWNAATGEGRLLSSANGQEWTSSVVGYGSWDYAYLTPTPQGLLVVTQDGIRHSPWDLRLQVLGSPASGAVRFQAFGNAGQTVELQAATTLTQPDWTRVSHYTLTTNSLAFTVPDAGNSQQRYYRARAVTP